MASFEPKSPQTQEELRAILRQDVVAASEALLGAKMLFQGTVTEIVETEAYRADDPGCHAYGKTKMKNMAMYGPPGHAYIYFTYGNHWMLCISAHEEGDPAAVLIRAVRPIEGVPAEKSLNGPGKLTKTLGIDQRLNSSDLLVPKNELTIYPGEPPQQIAISARIGLALGKGDETLWRFCSVPHVHWCTKHKFNKLAKIKSRSNS
jgi:DNA-3-methyladenine glycosylase